MIESVLDSHYSGHFRRNAYIEKSVIVLGAMEATLTPLMESIEAAHPGVKVFSLPSVDHSQWGRHIELGVKGEPDDAERAYLDLRHGLTAFSLEYGPELVR
jgi:molybdopterin-biosynthesis enzyme MoeA-like protein